jgi:hypothetical protein
VVRLWVHERVAVASGTIGACPAGWPTSMIPGWRLQMSGVVRSGGR